MSICIRQLETAQEIVSSQELRFRVWSEQEGVDLKDNKSGRIADDLDATAYHWGVFDDGKLVASARLTIHSNLLDVPNGDLFDGLPLIKPIASMNRLVVSKPLRGNGLAKKLDDLRISHAKTVGARTIVITAAKNNQSRIEAISKLRFIQLEREGIEKWSMNLPIVPFYLPLEREFDEQ